MYGKTVILAEKPSQAKAYADAFAVEKRDKTSITLKKCNTFPSGAIITWGIGHLVSLKMPNEYKEEWGKWNLANLPIVPDRFEFKVTKDKQSQFNAVKKLFSDADVIINACDVDKEGSEVLPPVQKGETTSSLLEVREGFTQPPKPYTEGGLINMMKTAGKLVEDEADSEILKEVEGIGTEATRSGIIETIKKNGYIEVKKNIVAVTEKGKILCEAIEGNLLSSPSMTAKWESYLKKIGEGKGSQENFLRNIQKFLDSTIDEAPKKLDTESVNVAVKEQVSTQIIGSCPVCNDGKMVDRQKFFGCSNYKNGCTFSISKTISGKKLTQKNIKDLLEKWKQGKSKDLKAKQEKPLKQFCSLRMIRLVSNSKYVFIFGKTGYNGIRK